MTETEEFHMDAASAFYLVGLLAAKLRIEPDVSIRAKAHAIEARVCALIDECRGAKLEAAMEQVKRLTHDVASLRTTNETLADQLAHRSP